MLGLILAILGFMLSLPGLVAILGGLVLFLCLPLISLASNFKQFSRLFLALGAFPIRRAAVVVSEHNDTLFKRMRFAGLGYEVIEIEGETKAFEDPDAALHIWNGIKFALADEEHGVLFDPRHAAIGMRKRLKDDHDEGEYLATTAEWDEWGVAKWKPGVFEMPSKHELVDLSAVQELIDGGEQAEFAERVENLYKHSRAPFASGTPPTKFLYPIIGFAVPFFGIMIGVDQFGGAVAPETVGYGAVLGLFGATATANWRKGLGLAALVGTPLLALAGLVAVFGPPLALGITVAVLFGMAILPLLTLLGQFVGPLGGALSKLYFRLGFLGYRSPVFKWTPERYVLREYDQLDSTDNVEWYGLFGTVVGFTYEPGPQSWGAEPISHSELEAQQPAATDGGRSLDSRLPPKYVRSERLQRDEYGGYIPKRLSDAAYYLRSGIAMNRFSDSATGEKSLRKLLEAKDQHGDANDGLDDSTVMWMTLAAGLLGLVSGVGLFILPLFL